MQAVEMSMKELLEKIAALEKEIMQLRKENAQLKQKIVKLEEELDSMRCGICNKVAETYNGLCEECFNREQKFLSEHWLLVDE